MTEALYYEIPMIVECSAKVLSCEEKAGAFLVELDRTPIFPEGGGQLPDRGSIISAGKTADITDCRTVDGRVLHTCTAAFDAGEAVTVRLDVPRRLDHAEQHTGEHILSGLASALFGAVNVGFHMAEDYCTIDLDLPLTAEQLEELELAANRAVRADLPVHTEVTDGDDASRRRLRKRAEKAQGEVRIVYIDNGKVDSCTCCGTHLPRTGMVGAIRITDSQHYKGGTRLWFACGGRASRACIEEHASLTALARQYSTSRAELPAVIRKQIDELAAVKAELRDKSRLLARSTASSLIAGGVNANGILVCCKALEGMGANDLKLVLDAAAEEREQAFVMLLFAANREGGTDYRMACSEGQKLSMKELCAAVNAAVNGKGGGGPLFAQGRTARAVDGATVEMLKNYLLKAIEG